MYKEIPLPTYIAFEPINLCNAKCYCCPYTTLSEDKNYHGKRMTRDQLGMDVAVYPTLLDATEVGSLASKQKREIINQQRYR